MEIARRALAAVALARCLPSTLRAQCGLLSWDDYRHAQPALPLVLRFAPPAGELLIFGVRHTRDPKDAQVTHIEHLWREFAPQTAFSEGGVRPAVPERDFAVSRFGEAGLLR